MTVTFNEIARKAGVSYSTVSRVINDHPSVSPDTVVLVRKVMEETGYCPPPPERRRGPMRGTPKKTVTGSLALLFPDADEQAVHTPLSAALAHGIETYLYEHRLSLVVTHLRDRDRLPVCLEKRQVDGVIVRSGDMTPVLVNRLRSYPSVWIFEPHPRIEWADHVLPDDQAVGAMAFDHLKEKGCSSFMVINPNKSHPAFRQRTQAFVTTTQAAGSEARLVEGFGLDDMTALNQSAWRSTGKTGVFLTGSEAAFESFCRLLREQRLESGRDVEVVACMNDVPRVRAVMPDVAIIDIQPDAIGRSAAERLLWRLENPREPIQRISITPRLDLA